MQRLNWQTMLAAGLIAFSAVVYLFHYIVFGDAHHIFIYLVGDIAFVPAEVLLVTIVLHRLLENREKQALLKKLNMVIGAFFSETGNELMERLITFDVNFDKVRPNLILKTDMTHRDFASIKRNLSDYNYNITSTKGNLHALKMYLLEHRLFLLRLLENPSLLEHDNFTNLLWAVFHLTEELAKRKDPEKLPDSDYEHISGDMHRAYVLLIGEWLDYMDHLREDYPYLFSLAVRANPFNPEASPIVR